MAEYHATTFVPPGSGRNRMAPPARRVDAAADCFRSAVFDVLQSLSLRDTEAVWGAYYAAIAAADTLRNGAVSARLMVAGHVVLCKRVA